jgi:DNA-binding NarL/FixJ family response regulator
MLRDIHVVIVEDDPFAREWMVRIVARDWRTRVRADLHDPSKLLSVLKKKSSRVDLILLDTDISAGETWISSIKEIMEKAERYVRIICTGNKPRELVLNQLDHPSFVGYLIKEEILYSLAWAIAFVLDGYWVITDSVLDIKSSKFLIPKPYVVLDGRKPIPYLTEKEVKIARLALLFSMERGELADELKIGEDWGYQLISKLYKRLKVKDIFSDENLRLDYFGRSKLIMSLLEDIREKSEGSNKLKYMETLAFHMVTMPKSEEIK